MKQPRLTDADLAEIMRDMEPETRAYLLSQIVLAKLLRKRP